MTCYLLDVNVLISLFDRHHIHHKSSHKWFKSISKETWSSCSITENGLIRILSNPKYHKQGFKTQLVIELLSKLKANSKNYKFWNDSVSITDHKVFKQDSTLGHKQLTDTYLLGLCKKNKGKLATYDKNISTLGIFSGSSELVEQIS